MAEQFRAVARYRKPNKSIHHEVAGRVHDDRERAERDLLGWLAPRGRASEGWIESRKVGEWERHELVAALGEQNAAKVGDA